MDAKVAPAERRNNASLRLEIDSAKIHVAEHITKLNSTLGCVSASLSDTACLGNTLAAQWPTNGNIRAILSTTVSQERTKKTNGAHAAKQKRTPASPFHLHALRPNTCASRNVLERNSHRPLQGEVTRASSHQKLGLGQQFATKLQKMRLRLAFLRVFANIKKEDATKCKTRTQLARTIWPCRSAMRASCALCAARAASSFESVRCSCSRNCAPLTTSTRYFRLRFPYHHAPIYVATHRFLSRFASSHANCVFKGSSVPGRGTRWMSASNAIRESPHLPQGGLGSHDMAVTHQSPRRRHAV